MLKTQPKRYTIKMLFKVQILPDHPTSKTKSGVLHPFCELYRTFNGISFINALPSSKPTGIFIRLSCQILWA